MSDELTSLDWTIELSDEDGAIARPLSELELVPADAAFTLSGEVPVAGYLYAIELGDARLAVLYPSDGGQSRQPAGAALRLPADESQFVAPLDGEVRVYVSATPIAAADWERLFPGREPDPGKAQGTSSTKQAPKRPVVKTKRPT